MLYKKEYGVMLEEDEACKLAMNLYDFFKIVAKPVDKRVIKSMKMKESV